MLFLKQSPTLQLAHNCTSHVTLVGPGRRVYVVLYGFTSISMINSFSRLTYHCCTVEKLRRLSHSKTWPRSPWLRFSRHRIEQPEPEARVGHRNKQVRKGLQPAGLLFARDCRAWQSTRPLGRRILLAATLRRIPIVSWRHISFG